MADRRAHADPTQASVDIHALVERAKAEAWDEGYAARKSENAHSPGESNPYRADSLAVQPAPTDDALCADCGSLMVEDNGAGYLCPTCDDHTNCDDFPCSGEAGSLCRLRAPLTDLLAAQPTPEAATVEEEHERIARAIEARRDEHWQRHLTEHPHATADSCPADYAARDAYDDAARIVRADSLAAPEAATPHCSTCTCSCTCGYGGLHDPENPNCDLVRRKP